MKNVDKSPDEPGHECTPDSAAKELEKPAPQMTIPDHFPTIVVKTFHGVYYKMPVYIVSKAEDLPDNLPYVCRIMVTRLRRNWWNEPVLRKLLIGMLKMESNYTGYDCCLVFKKKESYYFWLKSGEVDPSDHVPACSWWLPDSWFINYMAGPPQEQDESLAEEARLRLYCTSLRDVGMDIVQVLSDKGFIPSVRIITNTKQDE